MSASSEQKGISGNDSSIGILRNGRRSNDDDSVHSSHEVTPGVMLTDEQEEARVDIGQIPRRYIWRSCCILLDSRAVLYFSQLGISLLIIMFCIRQMSILDDPDSQRNYGMFLTFIIGVWFPAPKIGQ